MKTNRGGWLAAFTGLTVLLAAGCVDSTTVIEVQKDGSGRVVETVYLSKTVTDMMNLMAGGMGGGPNPAAGKGPLDIEQFRTMAPKMGDGVRFTSAREVKRADGSAGTEAIYTFSDIRKLKVSLQPQTPTPMGGMTLSGVDSEDENENPSPVRFDFVPGPTPRLVVSLPKPVPEPAAPAGGTAEKTAKPEAAAPDDPGMDMKQMFEGFRVRVLIKLDGQVTKSNAAYVEPLAAGQTQQDVTLLDMNVGELLKNPAQYERLQSLGKMDMDAARAKLQGMPGLKIETAERVEIEFR